jgi:hypothetical protein
MSGGTRKYLLGREVSANGIPQFCHTVEYPKRQVIGRRKLANQALCDRVIGVRLDGPTAFYGAVRVDLILFHLACRQHRQDHHRFHGCPRGLSGVYPRFMKNRTAKTMTITTTIASTTVVSIIGTFSATRVDSKLGWLIQTHQNLFFPALISVFHKEGY